MNIDGNEVSITRKDIKSLRLYVKPPNGAVVISAPRLMPIEEIEHFVRAKAGWIAKQQAKIAKQPRYAEHQYVTGETFFLWGKPYKLLVHQASYNAYEISEYRAYLHIAVRLHSSRERRQRLLRDIYRELLQAEVSRRLPRWQAVTGLACSSWQTRQMTSRWGTCNSQKKQITFSLQLVERPVECLDYIILHELLHLRVKNHGADFKALMDEYMPDWREVRKLLNG